MIPPLFRHSICRRLQRRCGAAHLLLKRLQPVMTRSARRDEPTSPPGAGHRLLAIGASILMGLVASSTAAAECSEASPETFSAFLSLFSTSPAFVLSRTEFPLHERQWADDDWLEEALDTLVALVDADRGLVSIREAGGDYVVHARGAAMHFRVGNDLFFGPK